MLRIESNGEESLVEVEGSMGVIVNDLVNVISHISKDLAQEGAGDEERACTRELFAAMMLVCLQEIWKDIPDLEMTMKFVKKHTKISTPSIGVKA